MKDNNGGYDGRSDEGDDMSPENVAELIMALKGIDSSLGLIAFYLVCSVIGKLIYFIFFKRL